MPRIAATDLMPDFTGWAVCDGQYRLLDKLGSGTYGKVYRALDTTSPPKNPRLYAIKCLLKHPAGSEKDILQQRELSIHQKVSGHPNIVTFYKAFHDDTYVFVVMGLYAGGDLFAAITEKRLYENQPLKIKATFLQILDAVQHCHSHGIFHRDIKPENVMCSEDGNTVYLGDFGLSTIRSQSREYGCGSSFYMSPECIGPVAPGGQNIGYSNRFNDIWALGVILTNLVTGRNPWRLATADDPCFKAYITNPNFLYDALPISSGVSYLLQRVFAFPANTRISIGDMHFFILHLGKFYKDKMPLPAEPLREIEPKRAQSTPAESICSPSKSDDTSYSSLDSEEYIYGADLEGMGLDAEPTLGDSNRLCASLVPPAPPTRSSGPVGGSGSSKGSGTGTSIGPITPASNAIEPDVEIPDVSQHMGGHDSSRIVKGPAQSPDKAHESKPVVLLKSAYQRLKGL